mgnify:CR=1 FL=1
MSLIRLSFGMPAEGVSSDTPEPTLPFMAGAVKQRPDALEVLRRVHPGDGASCRTATAMA